jgi:type IV pilus biogenesis/stability protein PilW
LFGQRARRMRTGLVPSYERDGQFPGLLVSYSRKSAQQMSRSRDNRRKRERLRSRPPVRAAATQNRPTAWTSRNRIVASVVLVLAAGTVLIWQASRSNSSRRYEATVQSTIAKPTNAPLALSLVPSNSGLVLAQHMEATNSVAKSNQAAIKLNQQANQLMTAGDVQGAIRSYEKALVFTPEDEDLHYNLGIAYAKAGDFTKAEQHYRVALRLLPDYAEVHNNFGNLLLRAGRWDEAAEHLNEAIKLQPEYAAAYNNLGIVRQRQKRLEEATANFEKAVAYDSNYLEAHFNLASASLLAGNRDKAVAEFQQVLRLDPTFEPAQRGLAKAIQK